jgi:mannose-1-phosphate guanylyltransferase
VQALILTGGQGTRLRPFTCDTPKPLLPVLNLPFLFCQLRLLKRHGIREVILATAYRPEHFRRGIGDGRKLGLSVRFVHERIPLGTGGAVGNASQLVRGPVLVLNGDVLNDLDIRAFESFHRRSRAELSIALVRVKDPTLYGLVETGGGGRILRFLEKPSWDEITCNTVNAGAYIFEPSVLAQIPHGVPYSLERGLFPSFLEQKRPMSGFVTGGYWMDIGTVEKYLQVHLDLLAGAVAMDERGLRRRGPFLLESGARLSPGAAHEGEGRVLLGRLARAAAFTRFKGCVCVGPGCVVEKGASLEDCVVLGGSRIGEGARLWRCVVGHSCAIGAHSSIGIGRALGDGSVVKKFSQL